MLINAFYNLHTVVVYDNDKNDITHTSPDFHPEHCKSYQSRSYLLYEEQHFVNKEAEKNK